MRLLCLTTCLLLWSISVSGVHGGVQMMLLKALQHVKTVPIILSVSRSHPKRYRASASEVVKVKAPPVSQENIARAPENSHGPAKYPKRKLTKKSRSYPKVKYIYIKSGYPKKHLKRSFSTHVDYFDGPVRKQILYEDDDHKFIRVSASRPKPSYTQVKVIHLTSAKSTPANLCPYLAAQAYKSPPHAATEDSVSKHEAASHVNSVASEQEHQVKHVIHHINYLGHLRDHEHREPYGSKPEATVQRNHDRQHHHPPHHLGPRPEKPMFGAPKGAPSRSQGSVNPQGPGSSAVTFHKDTGPSAGRPPSKPHIQLHLVNDKVNPYRPEEGRLNSFPQYFASSTPQRPVGRLPRDFYQPRFPEEPPENLRHAEPHQGPGTKFLGNPNHSDENPIYAESAVYTDVMNRWPGKGKLVISDVRGNPLVFASANSPPFAFRNGIRRRTGQNFIDLMFH